MSDNAKPHPLSLTSKISRSELQGEIEEQILANKRTGKPLYREICAWAAERGLTISPANISGHYKRHMQDALSRAMIVDAGRIDKEMMSANVTQQQTLRGVIYETILKGLNRVQSGKLVVDGRVLSNMIGRAIQLLEQEMKFFERHPYEFVARVMGEVLFDEPEVLEKSLKRLHLRAAEQATERQKNIRELWEAAGEDSDSSNAK